MALDPWNPPGAIGPAPGVGPAPVNVATPFGQVNGRGGFYGGLAGTLASAAIPGAGMIGAGIGTGFDVKSANDQLTNLGLDRSVAFGPSFANNMSFGLTGKSSRDQFQEAVTKAYPGLLQAMTPAPPVSDEPAAYAGTPSMGFFDGINDMNNVGRLGEVLDARGVPGGYQGGNEAGGMSSADSHGAQEAAQGPGNEGGMYRVGGIVPHDGDRRLEPVRATLHETEGVLRPEAMAEIGPRNFRAINKGGKEMREAMARILMRSGS